MMEFGLGSYGLSLVAGSLSTLSPCVLPLLPILLGMAVAAHRLGLYALAAGLTLSFTVVGVFVASLGSALGLDPALFRCVAAILLLLFGAILLSSHLQEKFAGATSGLSGAGQSLLSRVSKATRTANRNGIAPSPSRCGTASAAGVDCRYHGHDHARL